MQPLLSADLCDLINKNDILSIQRILSEKSRAKSAKTIITTPSKTHGRSPLLLALNKNNIPIIRYLCSFRPDLTIIDSKGLSVLSSAKSHESFTILADAWPHRSPGYPLVLACAGMVAPLRQLLRRTHSLVSYAWAGLDMLSAACLAAAAAPPVIDLLVTAGAPITRRHIAVCQSSVARARLLHHYLLPDRLHALAESGSPAQVSEELARGAALESVDIDGETPLAAAASAGRADTALVLLQAGADVRGADAGSGPFALATTPTVRKLLARAWPSDDPRYLEVLVRAGLVAEAAAEVAAGVPVPEDATPMLMYNLGLIDEPEHSERFSCTEVSFGPVLDEKRSTWLLSCSCDVEYEYESYEDDENIGIKPLRPPSACPSGCLSPELSRPGQAPQKTQ